MDHIDSIVIGAGIVGLAIARRAVELHRGSMRAANVHPGLEVRIDLPVGAPKASIPEPELAASRR